jgi:hypothetical protein
MYLRKQSLDALELDHLADLPPEDFSRSVDQLNLQVYSSWLLPQLVAHFGNWKLLGDGKSTVKHNCVGKHNIALYRLSMLRRSQLIKNQTQNPEYAQLTPLILLGLKRHQGFSYEQLRELPGLNYLLEPQLHEALVLDQLPQLSRTRLLEIRQQGLVYMTGKQVGQTRPAESTWKLYGIQGTEIGGIPTLAQTILAQIWLAHPKHRRASMILDLNDWDQMPEPLIDGEVVVQPKTAAASWEKPWLD